MSAKELVEVIDVDSRVVKTEAEPPATDGTTAAAPVEIKMLDPEAVVPALVQATEIAKINPALEAMRALSALIITELPKIDIATKAGEERARELRQMCVKLRTSTENTYKAWNKPILAAQKQARQVLSDVETGIAPQEDELDKLIKKQEAAREEERQRKVKEEEARMAALREKIAAISKIPLECVSLKAAEVDSKVRELQDLVITDDADSFGEFSDEAVVLRNSTVSQLIALANTKREQEDAAVRLEAQRKEQLERERAAEAERALREKIAQYQKVAFASMGKTAAQIKVILENLVAIEPLALEFGDLAKEAADTWLQAKTLVEASLKAQQDIEAQQEELRQQAEANERQRRELADTQAALQPKPTPAPTEAPAPSPAPAQLDTLDPFSDEFVGTGPDGAPSDAAPDTALASPAADQAAAQQLEQQEFHAAAHEAGLTMDPPPLSMSMFATAADYHAAAALQLACQVIGLDTAGEVAENIVRSLEEMDYPLEPASELTIVSLLLHPEIQDAWRARRDALIAAIQTEAA